MSQELYDLQYEWYLSVLNGRGFDENTSLYDLRVAFYVAAINGDILGGNGSIAASSLAALSAAITAGATNIMVAHDTYTGNVSVPAGVRVDWQGSTLDGDLTVAATAEVVNVTIAAGHTVTLTGTGAFVTPHAMSIEDVLAGLRQRTWWVGPTDDPQDMIDAASGATGFTVATTKPKAVISVPVAETTDEDSVTVTVTLLSGKVVTCAYELDKTADGITDTNAGKLLAASGSVVAPAQEEYVTCVYAAASANSTWTFEAINVDVVASIAVTLPVAWASGTATITHSQVLPIVQNVMIIGRHLVSNMILLNRFVNLFSINKEGGISIAPTAITGLSDYAANQAVVRAYGDNQIAGITLRHLHKPVAAIGSSGYNTAGVQVLVRGG